MGSPADGRSSVAKHFQEAVTDSEGRVRVRRTGEVPRTNPVRGATTEALPHFAGELKVAGGSR